MDSDYSSYSANRGRMSGMWWMETKKGVTIVTPFLSGYQDSNLGPPAPKAGALTGLRYTPIAFISELRVQRYNLFARCANIFEKNFDFY